MRLLHVLKNTPRYLLRYWEGLLRAVLTDSILTSLLFGAVALGFLVNPWAGVAAFFILYATFRTVNTVANAIGTTGNGLRTALLALLSQRGSGA